tara:strand:+ start:544 stop:675 length:132 start_codon:yes stop_codon:yes gene_type:complete
MPIVIRRTKNLKGRNDTTKRTPKFAPARGKKKPMMSKKKKKKY